MKGPDTATLYVSEFSNLPFVSNGVIQAPGAQYWLTDQTVAIGDSSAPSSAFNEQTAYVVLSADVACSIAWTAAGAEVHAATVANLLIPANAKPQIFGVAGGMRVSVIAT